MWCKSKTLYVVFFSVSLCQPAFADVESLLKLISQAYGGTQRILETQSYRQYGVTYSVLRGHEGKLVRAYQSPDHLRIEIDYGKVGSELRLLAGPHSWKQNKAVGEPFYSAMLLQATRLGLPAALLVHKQHVTEGKSIQNAEGKTLPVLLLPFHQHNQLQVIIDPDSGRILESHGIIKLQQFQMNFSTRYDDFRLVDERLFAFKETHFVMGRKTGYTNLERVVIEPLAKELFYPAGEQMTQPKTLATVQP